MHEVNGEGHSVVIRPRRTGDSAPGRVLVVGDGFDPVDVLI